jgi:hypothetical protein
MNITSALYKNSKYNSTGLAFVLGKIDYVKLMKALRRVSRLKPTETINIVLLDYIHSGVDDKIASFERIPNTSILVNDILNNREILNELAMIFKINDQTHLTQCYTRRKIDYNVPTESRLTNKRQLVLQFEKYTEVCSSLRYDDGMPPLINLPECFQLNNSSL